MENEVIESLNTEGNNPRSRDLDQMTSQQIVALMNQEDQAVIDAVHEAQDQIGRLAEAAYQALQAGGRVFYVGAGTSGRLGILDASECPPTFGVSAQLFQGVIAGGKEAIFKAKEGVEDSPQAGQEALQAKGMTAQDIVIGIAASGRTPFVLGALSYAKEVGASTGSVSCVAGAKVSSLVDFPVEVVTGPEVLAGSTRLKAGSAQKMVLNMISTAAMVRSGKAYQNYMVDLKTSNQKLEKRAINILKALIHEDIDYKALLEAADYHVKTALVMHKLQVDRAQAQAELAAKDGHVRLILENR
ncbi:N-acetylmuramic acid 6-phosphate etherase [Eremococcus coleocola]|uniref:N-acetylmuramic acid 6-phosphate etherase n=1 Tax=Eremococcus coleocola ACS-139-V-Col8 TaxID=908337 RepID=E4KR38_9LACT|nr:N-acetylmuramic acid 6-phosphate etherase [Eremococcus coleocola]EFR30692.1 N-acetylmuramic acid 6-phosphate etherase [Eremococcus coleocola ACS-139-V-Col8]